MTVRSEPLKSPRPKPEERDSLLRDLLERETTSPPRESTLLLWLGDRLALATVGLCCFLLNGGFSIQGIIWLCQRTGVYAQMFLALAAYLTVPVPGFEAQPILLWGLVLAISLYQIHSFRRRPLRFTWRSGIASLFDYGTTAIGLGTLDFAQNQGFLTLVWWGVSITLAVPVTFGVEYLLAKVLKGR